MATRLGPLASLALAGDWARWLWQRSWGGPVSEPGRLSQGAGGHEGGHRCWRGLMLSTLVRRDVQAADRLQQATAADEHTRDLPIVDLTRRGLA